MCPFRLQSIQSRNISNKLLGHQTPRATILTLVVGCFHKTTIKNSTWRTNVRPIFVYSLHEFSCLETHIVKMNCKCQCRKQLVCAYTNISNCLWAVLPNSPHYKLPRRRGGKEIIKILLWGSQTNNRARLNLKKPKPTLKTA